jgi:hypothetical protein
MVGKAQIVPKIKIGYGLFVRLILGMADLRRYIIILRGVQTQSRLHRPFHPKHTHSTPFHHRSADYSQPLSDQIVLVTFSDELASTFIYGGAGRIWRIQIQRVDN